ncbi:ATP-binding protein [Rubritalea marina]|uniref:ATP-binding protein n=1 Tax=Rubritalea marina TaxID=361055 RepID=UPI0014614C8E|nr:ATP-binding protein [Rubritalea marina]
MIEKTEDILAHCLDWLQLCIDKRVKYYFELVEDDCELPEMDLPSGGSGGLVGWMRERDLNQEEQFILLLSIASLVRPEMLDVLFSENKNTGRRYTEFGGVHDNAQQGGFVPSVQTALFLLAGGDIGKRLKVMRVFRPDHFFFKERILEAPEKPDSGVLLKTALRLTPTALYQLLWQDEYSPDLRSDFPAKRVRTSLQWDDLVLSPGVKSQVMEIRTWMEHEEKINNAWGLKKILKPGYRALFHGPPGTGKTLTAGLLGSALGRDVYRIDLSMVVSKFIGETEKNLAAVFDLAENENWVLFFDEADALFGKRTQTQSSNDRFANQEVSYLLQRVEDFPGLVILASNFKGNVDPAFVRRFQSLIYFPLPKHEQRLQLWRDSLGHGLRLAEDVDLEEVSNRHELAGGEIVNVVRTVAITVASRHDDLVRAADIEAAIRKEFQKDGRVVS